MSGRLQIEVVFGLADRQELLAVTVDSGTTVAAAIAESGIADRFPEHELDSLAVGIWGRVVAREQVLADGDRIEIYRPLDIDPREARRRLAAEGRAMGGSGLQADEDSEAAEAEPDR